MRKVILIFFGLVPFAMGQVVEKAEITGYEITLMGVPAEEQARINRVYPVDKNGFVELGEIGKVEVKGKSAWAVAKAIRDACLKAEISEEAIFIMRPITEADSNEVSWFLLGGQENKARGRSWQEPLTLFAAVANAGGSKVFGDAHRIKLYRNGKGYTYDLKKDRHKGLKIYPHDLIEVLGAKLKKVEPRKFGEDLLSEDSPKATIGGQVYLAGQQQWKKEMTMESMIKDAGGVKPNGDLSRVRLYRKGKMYIYDLSHKKNLGIRINEGDLVEVVKKGSGEAESKGVKGVNSWREVQLSVVGVPHAEQKRLNGSYKVAEDGTITMWKIGKINTRGKTGGMLATEIAKAYEDAGIYSNPVFSVPSLSYLEHQSLKKIVVVRGQVKKLKVQNWEQGMTLGEVIVNAGGATKEGDLSRVKLYREAIGEGEIYTYDLTAEKNLDIKIVAKDIVEVPSKNE